LIEALNLLFTFRHKFMNLGAPNWSIALAIIPRPTVRWKE
jgi:hypothetical protein